MAALQPRIRLFVKALPTLLRRRTWQNMTPGVRLRVAGAVTAVFSVTLFTLLLVFLPSQEPKPFPLREEYRSTIRYVWNKALAASADVIGPDVGIVDDDDRNTSTTWDLYRARIAAFHPPQSSPGRHVVVYVITTQLPHFIQAVLPHVHRDIILVTGCSDQGPVQVLGGAEALSAVLEENHHIVHWFAQNCDFPYRLKERGGGRSVHLHCIPIGLDFHSQATGAVWWGPALSPVIQDSALHTAALMATPLSSRQPRAYMDFSIHTNKGPRAAVFFKFSNVPFVEYPLKSLTRADLWKKYSEFAFVLSPPGNGRDCHRSWEALVLGAVPIMLHSHLDPLFEYLPVVLIEKWEEVTSEALERWQREITQKSSTYDMTKLKNEYWVRQIHAAASRG